MSNLEADPRESRCGGTGDVPAEPVREVLYGRDVVLGGTRGMPVVRTLPNKHRRMVGAWCFVDHYSGNVSMRVPPHPHTALQTVTWLVTGEVRHRDSLGSDQVIRPGQLNLMTAGQGIAHAEDSIRAPAASREGGSQRPPAASVRSERQRAPQSRANVARSEERMGGARDDRSSAEPGPLHGVQLWVALPGLAASVAPAFAHHATLPSLVDGAVTTRLLAGAIGGERSPAYAYTPLVGAEIAFAEPARTVLPLEPDFEYAVLTLSEDEVTVDGAALPTGPLLYLGTGRRSLELGGGPAARALLLGGEPFAEEMIMWWNFIGRTHDEIVAAREDWTAGRRFGTVAYEGPPLPAPDLPITRLMPRGRTR